ncbi:MAG: MFS transporter [Pseudomonadota bacterium]
MPGLVVLCVGYVLSQFYRAFLAVLTPDLIADLGATSSELSQASGMWFLTFAIMQFAVGVSLDKYGPRRTASLFLGVAGGAGVFLFSFAGSPLMITVAMGLIGVGCAPILMATLFIFARTFNPARFATLTSVFIGIGTLGNVAGATPLAWAVGLFGWREVVFTIGMITVATAAAMFFFVKDPEAAENTDGGGLSGYIELLRMRVLWWIFPLMAVNYAAAAGVRGLWAGPMLIDIYAADALVIGQVTLWMALAMSAGSFIYGPMDRIFNTRKWVAFAGTSVGVVAMLFVAVNPSTGLTGITIAFIAIGLTGMVYGVIMAHARGFFPSHLTGRGITLMNFFSIGGVSVMQVATGSVVANYGAENAEQAYSRLFWFYVIAVALPLFLYSFSKDTKPASP